MILTRQMVCAIVFGSEESSGESEFHFSQRLVDEIVSMHMDYLSGPLVFATPVLPAHFFRALVHLCISGVRYHAALCCCCGLIHRRS